MKLVVPDAAAGFCLLACGAELGAGGGVEARSGVAVGYGRAAASTKLGTPLNDEGFQVGASLESRAQARAGVRYDTGIMLGWGSGPAALGGRSGFELYCELGTPIQQGFLRDGNFFAGAAIAAPLFLGQPRQVADLNNSTWLATSRIELVPSLRSRLHVDHAGGGDPSTKIDVQVGLALRLRVISDLF
jgi:hypothetical protein